MKTILHHAAHAAMLVVGHTAASPFRIGSAWVEMKDLERNDVKTAWAAIIEREIRTAIVEERERCRLIVSRIAVGPDFAENEEERADAEYQIRFPSPDPAETER